MRSRVRKSKRNKNCGWINHKKLEAAFNFNSAVNFFQKWNEHSESQLAIKIGSGEAKSPYDNDYIDSESSRQGLYGNIVREIAKK